MRTTALTRRIGAAVMVAFLLQPLLGSPKPLYADQVKAVPNGGFESDLDRWWTWVPSTSADQSPISVITDASAHGGSKYATFAGRDTFTAYLGQNITGLDNGAYTLGAWVKASGGATMFMQAKEFDNSGRSIEYFVRDPINDWTYIEIKDIPITNGSFTITFGVQDAIAGQFFYIDDVVLYFQEDAPPSSPGDNVVSNPGFEDDNAEVAVPRGWFLWSANPEDQTAFSVRRATDVDLAHSGSYYARVQKDRDYELYILQSLSNLSNGKYTLGAWVRSSGGQSRLFLQLKDYDNTGSSRLEEIPLTAISEWRFVSIKDIPVANHNATITFGVKGGAGQWFAIDDVVLYNQEGGAGSNEPLPAIGGDLAGPEHRDIQPLASYNLGGSNLWQYKGQKSTLWRSLYLPNLIREGSDAWIDFRREVTVPPEAQNRVVKLTIQSLMDGGAVFINDNKVKDIEYGLFPSSIDITPYVSGSFTLTVRAYSRNNYYAPGHFPQGLNYSRKLDMPRGISLDI